MTVVQGFQLDTHKNYFFNTSKTFLLTRFGLGTFFVALLLILNSAFQLIMTNVVQRSAIVTLIVGIVFLFEGFVVSLIFGELQRRQNRYSNNQQSLRDALMRERVEMFVKEEALKALSFKQTELETERLKADQANKAKSLFLANMSHEIRTPLVSVLGYAELLRDSNISIETARMYGSIIERTGNTLLEIINDVLDLSKVEAGQLVVEKIPFSVPRFLSEINTVLKIKSEQKSLKLIFQERIIGPEFIVSDPNRLRQILMNLIGNAIKFTNHGEVKVSSTVEKNNITFYVQDTGIGITELQQQQLFQNFNQGDNSVTRRFAGTGLGLALSRHLARKLGGDISLVQTDINHGTTFALKIPYMLPNNEELILSRNQSAKLMLEKNLFQKSILVVDDALDNQILIKTILTDWGFKVTLASNGQEAVDRVKTENFDLILMDMQMPVKDGYTACRELIVSNSDVPIVALTAHAMKEDRDLCLQAGCCDYITKPIKKNQLLLTIQKNLEHACA